ncbi:MAG: class I SAM-dependent methyltransferase [Solirubrobacteraceae bacterium]
MSGEPPSVVQRHFDANADYWRDVYDDPGVSRLVYGGRMATGLEWIDGLGLTPGAPVLDAGCGAGLLSVALAQRGLTVTATDASTEMLARTRQSLAASGLTQCVTVQSADAARLRFGDEQFALVTALGLLPWVPDVTATITELARVAQRPGWLLVSADNRARLSFLLEPRESPLLGPAKAARGIVRRARGIPEPHRPRMHRPAEIDQLLRAAGLEPVRRATFGFGPFTFLGRPLLWNAAAVAAHERLQRSGATSAALRRTGWHYIVLARRAGYRPAG